MYRLKHMIIPLFLFLILAILPYTTTSLPENVEKITLIITYDPSSNQGIVSETIMFDQVISDNPVLVDIPLLNASSILVINITDENGEELPYSYDEESNIVRVYVNNTKSVKIYYMVTGLMDELAPGAYSCIIDLSMYSGYDVEATLELIDKYNVESTPEATVAYSDNTTLVIMNTPDTYIITIYKIPSTTVPTATTTTTTPSTTTTTLQTMTTGATGTQTTVVTLTPQPSTTAFSQQLLLLIVVIVIIVVAIVAILLTRR